MTLHDTSLTIISFSFPQSNVTSHHIPSFTYRYHGHFFQNAMHGNGTVYFENGDVYIGELEDNCPHGFGTYYCNVPAEAIPTASVASFGSLIGNSALLFSRELRGRLTSAGYLIRQHFYNSLYGQFSTT